MAKFDHDLLFLYSESARIKIKKMSVLLNKSPQRLKYTLNTLEKEGIIKNPHCIFDYSFFGLIMFRIYFKGGYISEKDKQNIVNLLNDNPYVVSIYELSGEFDLAIEMEAPNPSKFNKELKRIISTIPELNNYKIVLNIVTHNYPKTYLLKNQGLINLVNQDVIVGGDRVTENFNENEMKILHNLLKDPKTRLTALAKKCDLNIKTVISTLKILQEKYVLKGFKYMIDANKLEIYRHRLFIKLHNMSQERESQLMYHLFKTKEIVGVNKTVGDWDLEVDVESIDKSMTRYITIQLKEEFKDLIETFNIIEIYQYYKKSYLPAYLFLPK